MISNIFSVISRQYLRCATSSWETSPHFNNQDARASVSLQWRHNERDGVSNHQRLDCLFKRLFRRKTKKTSKLRVTGLCEGNSPVNGEFPAPRASNAENVPIWWRHHVFSKFSLCCGYQSITLTSQQRSVLDTAPVSIDVVSMMYFGLNVAMGI